MQPENTPQQFNVPPIGASGPYSTVPPQPSHKSPTENRLKSALSTILLLASAPIAAILLTIFVFQSYEVEGPSMLNTLHDGDRLIVLKAPKTWASLRGTEYIPSRGDIIVFNKAEMETGTVNEGDKQLIKRVIGLPGERVVVKNGSVTVYNDSYPNGFNPDKNTEWSSNISTTLGSVDLIVPTDSVFVCGDNRMNSLDSRSFGPVASQDIVGRLTARIMPLGDAQTF